MQTRNAVVSLDHYGLCPACGASWDGGDIFEILRQQEWCKDKTDDALRRDIAMSYAPPHRFSRLVGIEYTIDHPQHYDGVSKWMCPDCKHTWPRFEPSENAT